MSFGDRLSVLARLEQRQLVGVLAEDVCGLEKERGALGRRAPAPVGLECAVGRLTRSIHLRAAAPWTMVMTSPVAGSSIGNGSASSGDDQRKAVSSGTAVVVIASFPFFCVAVGAAAREVRPQRHRPTWRATAA
jgi:hypothetical protein